MKFHCGLLILVFTAVHGEKLTAQITIPFDVAPNDHLAVIYDLDARHWYPPEDIYMTTISFKGVTVNGNKIPFHADPGVYQDEELNSFTEGIPYIYHHTTPHTANQAMSKKKSESRFHRLGGIAAGTHEHRTDTGEYGYRFRPDTYIFYCMHAYNFSKEHATFHSNWEIEYQLVVDNEKKHMEVGEIKEKDTKPLVQTLVLVGMPDGSRVGMDYLSTVTATLNEDVTMVGLGLHKHQWNHRTDILDNNGLMIWTHDDTPSDDGSVIWIDPIKMKKNSSFQAVIDGQAEIRADLHIATALVFYFTLDDGGDRVEINTDFGLLKFSSEAECLNCYNQNN